MGIIEDSFKKELGKNTGKFVSNLVFGDKHSTPYRRVGSSEAQEARAEAARIRAEAAQAKADAIAREHEVRAEIEEKNHLNSLDAAVLANVDKVIAMPFSEDTNELAHQLSGLAIQLSTNSFSKYNAEDKIRAKYTEAVFQKFDQGLQIMLAKDPYNPNMDYLWETFIKAKEKRDSPIFKIFKILIKLLCIPIFLLGLFLLFLSSSISEGAFGIFIITISILVIVVIKNKDKNILKKARHNYDITTHYQQPTTHTNQNITAQSESQFQSNYSFNQKQEFDHLWNKYSHLSPLMKNGYRICQTNEQKDILIVGLYCNTDHIINGRTIYPLSQHERISSLDYNLNGAGDNLQNHAAYMDLFPIQSTSAQFEILKEIIQNPKMFDYVVEQISLNQTIIEDVVCPKLIIIQDNHSWAFFGKLPEFVWMGYEFQLIEKTAYGDLCRIVGFRSDDRIQPDRKQTNLIGTKVLFHQGITFPATETKKWLNL
ncbi:MAG: hypothetical protein IKJ98_10540 [Bacteroidales bacterium]|nr:hypothetical protein [Bacteroidales bacterium]